MGKPSAPVQGVKGCSHETGYYEGVEGLTIRQYFMAHAPAEPQKWFNPVIGPRPEPCWPDGRGQYGDKSPANKQEIDAYDAEYVKQKYAQWPAAWADAVLAAGEK